MHTIKELEKTIILLSKDKEKRTDKERLFVKKVLKEILIERLKERKK